MARNHLFYAALIQKIQNAADALREAEAAAQLAGDTQIFAKLHAMWKDTGDLSRLAMKRGAEAES